MYILTGIKTFAKEPELTTIMQRQNLTSVSSTKIKFAGFLSHVCNPKFAAFGCFAAGLLANGCFFLAWMGISIGLHRSVK